MINSVYLHDEDRKMQPGKILLVEDDLETQKVTNLILNKCGHTVYLASSFKDVLELLRNHQLGIDLAIIDIILPVLSGFTVMEYLRAHPIYKRVPLIAMTARKQTDDYKRAKKIGCSHFIDKPYVVQELLSVVTQLIRHPLHENDYCPT